MLKVEETVKKKMVKKRQSKLMALRGGIPNQSMEMPKKVKEEKPEQKIDQQTLRKTLTLALDTQPSLENQDIGLKKLQNVSMVHNAEF